MNEKEYRKLAEARTPGSPVLKNCLFAFLAGGGICAVGEVLRETLIGAGIAAQTASTLVSCLLIVAGALLTGLGVYDKFAKHAGAGSLVPITGFANAIVSPAMEFRTEGLVTGIGAKLFAIAGPVLVYGITASVLYGAIYYLFLRL